jgi:hypothetical protein
MGARGYLGAEVCSERGISVIQRVVFRGVVICAALVALSWVSGCESRAASPAGRAESARGGAHPNATCNLPAAQGDCKGNFQRFRYDAGQRACVAFTYGGCGGNANLFETLAACRAACP